MELLPIKEDWKVYSWLLELGPRVGYTLVIGHSPTFVYRRELVPRFVSAALR
jgi:hypothetical protein